jgi:hypothetical protein
LSRTGERFAEYIHQQFGHKQIATTARYAHLDIDPQRRASEYIGQQLSAALGHGRRPPEGDSEVVPIMQNQEAAPKTSNRPAAS